MPWRSSPAVTACADEITAYASSPGAAGCQAGRRLTGGNVTEINYQIYLPPGFGTEDADTPTKKWPLIFFLHGSGEGEGKFCTGKTVSGAEYDLGLNDVDSVCYHGLPHKITDRAAVAPHFIVVSPQAPASANASWSDADGVALEALEDLGGAITQALAVDLSRVYLTGLSMGGAGTWNWAAAAPDHFAAIAPICGGIRGDPAPLKDVPAWLFVGATDGVSSAENAKNKPGYSTSDRLLVVTANFY